METNSNKSITKVFGLKVADPTFLEEIKTTIAFGILSPIFSLEKIMNVIEIIENNDRLEYDEISVYKKMMENSCNEFTGNSFQINFIKNKIENWEKKYFRFTDDEIIFIFTKRPEFFRFFSNRILRTPKMIAKKLSTVIIGQEKPLMEFSNFIYQWIKYWQWKENGLNCLKPMSAKMIIGGSGSGKTYTINKIAQILDCEVISIDASKLVTQGYVGEHFTTGIITQYNNLTRKKRIIVHIDEFDKLADKYQGSLSVKGRAVLNEMLKVLESNEISGLGNYRNDSDVENIDSSNFCYILSGAFEGIKDISIPTIGFGTETTNSAQEITLNDLIDYGLPKEILGRISSGVIVFNDVNREMLKNILYSEESTPLKYYLEFFKRHNKEIDVEEHIDEIIDKAMEMNVGVRGLFQSLENYFNTILQEL